MMSLSHAMALVEKYTQPSAAPFYRNLYGGGAPKRVDSDSWHTLPFVTKEALLAASLEERIFAPRQVDHIRASSGTSGKPPLFSPRTYLRGMEYRTEYHDFKKPILAYWIPAAPHWHEHFQEMLGVSPCAIVFDPKNPAASVRLAKNVGVDSISTFAFHIMMIGEHMVREKMNDDIRFIEICGEACTSALFEYIRSTFPNATVIPFYGSSEVEDSPIGMPCKAIDGTEPLSIYHAKNSQYHELIDPENDKVIGVRTGVEGELVISAYPGEPTAFPLIRYRTGDMVRVVEEQCLKHNSWSFTVIGRAAMDFVKVPGGVLRADEALRVVRTLKDSLSERFEMHVYEDATVAGPRFRIEMHVEPLPEVDLENLATILAQNLRINPNFTYAEGVAEGRFAPLRCKQLVAPAGSGKTKRLIKH